MEIFKPRPLIWHGIKPVVLEQAVIAYTSIGDFTIVCTKIKRKKNGDLQYYYTWSFCFEEELCPDDYVIVGSFKKAKLQCKERWEYESKLVVRDIIGKEVFGATWSDTN